MGNGNGGSSILVCICGGGVDGMGYVGWGGVGWGTFAINYLGNCANKMGSLWPIYNFLSNKIFDLWLNFPQIVFVIVTVIYDKYEIVTIKIVCVCECDSIN